jgi:uncharacterized protein YggE
MRKSFIWAFLLIVTTRLWAAETNHEKMERTLTVQGQGKSFAVPDIATLSVEVSQEEADLDPILTQVRKQMAKVLEVIKGQGIADKDVQTEIFQVHPTYERDKHGNPHPTGFRVANRVAVKIRDLKKTGRVLSAVLSAGANTVEGPNFELDNPQGAEREALAAATKDAKAKAESVAQAAGVQLGEILTINPENINWPVRPRPMMMRSMAAASAMSVEEPMAAGEQTISGTVTLTYAIH